MKLIITDKTAELKYMIPFEGKCQQFFCVIDLQTLNEKEADELIKSKVKSALLDMISRFLKHRLECYSHIKHGEKVALVTEFIKVADVARHKPLSYLFTFVLESDWHAIMPRKENRWNAIIRLMQKFTTKINNQLYN